MLYYKGDIQPTDGLAIAIVGSRRCTPYGLDQARKIAGGLARAGITVVSGLARGIDAAAHRGALEAGGRTLAVFATGLGTVYPPEHKDLAGQVEEQGALITESCFDQLPIAGLFPQRNRIISGLSLGVILIEASRKSGSLHTARHAMEQGREVFAVPGRIDSIESQGCLDLIRDGATLIRGVEDILEELGPLTNPVQSSHKGEIRKPIELNLNDQETLVLNTLSTNPKHIDEVLRALSLDSSQVLSTLTVLEMKQLIRRHPGNYLSRP
ncbi:MAG: DNA-processing protein DprA [Planctomycetaceae bacterium]